MQHAYARTSNCRTIEFADSACTEPHDDRDSVALIKLFGKDVGLQRIGSQCSVHDLHSSWHEMRAVGLSGAASGRSLLQAPVAAPADVKDAILSIINPMGVATAAVPIIEGSNLKVKFLFPKILPLHSPQKSSGLLYQPPFHLI